MNWKSAAHLTSIQRKSNNMVAQRRYSFIMSLTANVVFLLIIIYTSVNSQSVPFRDKALLGILFIGTIICTIYSYIYDKNNIILFKDDGILVVEKGIEIPIAWSSVLFAMVSRIGPYKFINIIYSQKDHVPYKGGDIRLHYSQRKEIYLREKRISIKAYGQKSLKNEK